MTKHEKEALANNLSHINSMAITDIDSARQAIWLLLDVCDHLLRNQIVTEVNKPTDPPLPRRKSFIDACL
jgi:hypothetical protein